MTRRSLSFAQAQVGATLIVALVFLLILTMAGVTAMRFSTFEERMASNTQLRNQTFQQAQSELRAQLLAFNANQANIDPLLQAMGKGVAPRQPADLLADPTLASLPTTTLLPIKITPKMSNINADKNTVRFTQDKICDDGSSVEKFVCISYEMNTTAELAGGTYSWQSQGITFQNNK
ncbi:pilus assembly PilX family protein [Pseudomonas sp. MBLB4123]|uniref:pilus assembly PilX family protein n=1 Tax=Pseudomonas sp. MBLB4123 TaxID=3451557 RepID=UPI003F7533F7